LKQSTAAFDPSYERDVAPLSVRPVITAADHMAAAQVLKQAYEPYRSIIPAVAATIQLSELFELRNRLHSGVMLLARRRGRVVGAAICHPEPSRRPAMWPRRWASLRALAVTPEARRYGVGRMLVQGCMVHARYQGASALCMHVAEFMIPGHDFARRLGMTRMHLFDFELGPDDGFEPGRPVPVQAYVVSLAD
jgi:predicted N-acetyltransferase YhbS